MAADPVAELVGALVGDDALTGATLSKPRRVDPPGRRRSRSTRSTCARVRGIAGVTTTRRRPSTRRSPPRRRRTGSLISSAARSGKGCCARPRPTSRCSRAARHPGSSVARPAARTATRTHDRSKQRLLPEGVPVPFLVELGVMTAGGAVRAQRQDKYRQVNRFLELVEDVLPSLPEREAPRRRLRLGAVVSHVRRASPAHRGARARGRHPRPRPQGGRRRRV